METRPHPFRPRVPAICGPPHPACPSSPTWLSGLGSPSLKAACVPFTPVSPPSTTPVHSLTCPLALPVPGTQCTVLSEVCVLWTSGCKSSESSFPAPEQRGERTPGGHPAGQPAPAARLPHSFVTTGPSWMAQLALFNSASTRGQSGGWKADPWLNAPLTSS